MVIIFSPTSRFIGPEVSPLVSSLPVSVSPRYMEAHVWLFSAVMVIMSIV